jgi:hypothetical protein
MQACTTHFDLVVLHGFVVCRVLSSDLTVIMIITIRWKMQAYKLIRFIRVVLGRGASCVAISSRPISYFGIFNADQLSRLKVKCRYFNF